MKTRVLVVDDEKLIRWSLENKLSSWGYEVLTAEDTKSANRLLEEHLPDLVLLDIKLPDGNGLDILDKIQAVSSDVAVIMITAEATVETALRAMKSGAYDYVVKPFNLQELRVLIEKALAQSEMKRSLDYYEADRHATLTRERLIGDSPRFTEMLSLAQKVAASPMATVLLLGESGTGKNIIARSIHNQSARASKPFVTIECTTIPENLLESELFGHEKGAFTDARTYKKGLFELADGGTIFIDEIGDLPLSMQGKLLRIIDEKRFKRVGGVTDFMVDVRVVAATNKSLSHAVENKQFRRDLYYRLSVVPIVLPPLRDRGSDIIRLAEVFISDFNKQFGKNFTKLHPDARAELLAYPWPGNVRELRNAIERVVLLETGNEILKEHLALRADIELVLGQQNNISLPSLGQLTLDELEIEMIKRALAAVDGNQSQAARMLGVSRDVLRYRMKKYDLS